MYNNTKFKIMKVKKFNYLLLTLGHNSSAIFVHKTGKVVGYEQERLSGIKGDSSFPYDCINEIRKYFSPDDFKNTKVVLSHWFDSDHPVKLGSKYATADDIHMLTSQFAEVISHDNLDNFTHHDAHAYSAACFFHNHLKAENKKNDNPTLYIVADGFGTDQEVLSTYVEEIGTPLDTNFSLKLDKRVYGYTRSLGLMYQYATSFCGMKENQDEYKFLGYEPYIDYAVTEEQLDTINHHAMAVFEDFVDAYTFATTKPHISLIKREDPAYPIRLDDLEGAKSTWYRIFSDLIQSIAPEFKHDKKSNEFRAVMAHFIQLIVENMISHIIREYGKGYNVVVSGGLFYNVKLNNVALNKCSELFCAMPLAGDQGAAIGFISAMLGPLYMKLDNLCIGTRDYSQVDKVFTPNSKHVRVIKADFASDVAMAARKIAQALADGRIVNLVTGNMEFGPRALCNTSTLFLPTAENTARNNSMNGRNEVMPCAPVMLEETAKELFNANELKRTVGSDKFMICTHLYNQDYIYSAQRAGIMHRMPDSLDRYTGRPQIIAEKSNYLMHEILKYLKKYSGSSVLVNTSFNVHGNPIVFDLHDIAENHRYQVQHSEKGKEPFLFIVIPYEQF